MNPLVEQARFDSQTFSHPLPDDAPIFCPVCSRPLEYVFWDTDDGDYRYSAFACFGGSWKRLFRRFKIIWPWGLHYRFEFGPTPKPTEPYRFDKLTGKRLP